MSKFKTGDLVRYAGFNRSRPTTAASVWRMSRTGLIMSEVPSGPRPWLQSSTMYNVLWNDNPKPLIVRDWDLELVPEED